MESTDTNDKIISQDCSALEADTVTSEYNKQMVCTMSKEKMQESGHLYDDAINLAGNGRYNIGLLTTLALMTLAVAIDIYSFSVVLLSSVCELKFDHNQTNLLMSVPFIGPILMSYAWGYISDTRGRRKSLIVASFISFLASIVSAFSPNWVTLGVFKFISTSCSSCAFSVTYALMSESCPRRVRGSYVFIMSSMLFFAACVYYSIGYFVLNLKFALDISFIKFTPWRLLVVILAFPFGISCLALTFFYESPKFLLNSGYETEALELLERIYYRNGGAKGTYPVKKIRLLEDDILRDKNVPFLKSLWKQTTPLFKPPLLVRTLQLYYLTAVMYSTDNSFFIWFPFLLKAYSKGLASSSVGEQGLCSAIEKSQIIQETSNEVACDPTLDLLTCASSIIPSFLCVVINLIISKLSSRRKTLMLVILTSILVCCVGSVLVKNNMVSVLLFIGVLFICLNASMVFSYFTDLYPTTYRGMVVSLSGMVARSSALGGTNLVGYFVMTNCSTTFYAWSVYILSGLLVACFLPSDRPKTII